MGKLEVAHEKVKVRMAAMVWDAGVCRGIPSRITYRRIPFGSRGINYRRPETT